MKKQRREKSDRYRSIGQKQMTVLIVSVLLSILLFSGYFFFSVRQNSVQEYVQRSENAVDAVSYTHLDVYKRQEARSLISPHAQPREPPPM